MTWEWAFSWIWYIRPHSQCYLSPQPFGEWIPWHSLHFFCVYLSMYFFKMSAGPWHFDSVPVDKNTCSEVPERILFPNRWFTYPRVSYGLWEVGLLSSRGLEFSLELDATEQAWASCPPLCPAQACWLLRALLLSRQSLLASRWVNSTVFSCPSCLISSPETGRLPFLSPAQQGGI